ncbi:MAG TPA: succinate dehydrogenase cytochrome b subunit [Chitinophagaceae bacterium]|nr:succinate dehydrogenase cytochrome b subunit [Chitinophagaceae bacterium]
MIHSWKTYFTSSIGRKFIMAFTGLFLISFLVVHAGANSCIFLNDQGETFNAVAHFLSHNWIIRFLEIGLFAGIIAHVIQGIMLERSNRSKRKIAFDVKPGNATSKWYSRSMGLLGVLILLFLIVHLSQFWYSTKVALYAEGDAEHNMYQQMKEVFQHEWVLLVYLIGVVALGWHLKHGFWSAFQTFGINSPKYNSLIKSVGMVYTIIICLAFISMPLAFYFKWLN